MDGLILRDVVEGVLGVLVLYLSYKEFLTAKEDRAAKAQKDQSKTDTDLELKVKELEGKIATQYGELSVKLSNLEKSITDSKNTNFAFETRILANLDKVDNKLERLQEAVLRSIYNLNQNTNKNEK